MKIELRDESVVISGYVNAVERYSKPITANLRGEVRTFVEKIKAGAFRTALKRNDDVKVLLNHDKNIELATTQNGSAKLEEDNIGLRAEVTITDADVVEKARNNKLVGWSFGFFANKDEVGTEKEMATREIEDLDLLEVSILDDTKKPAYYGTSIETRGEDARVMECRATVEEIEPETVEEQVETDAQAEEARMEMIAEKVAEKVIAKLTAQRCLEEKVEKQEIDYSAFEQRLANLK